MNHVRGIALFALLTVGCTGFDLSLPPPVDASDQPVDASDQESDQEAGTQSSEAGTATLMTTVSQQQVDKVDLLFMIDNSSSMADKQAILSQAVPQLLNGLLQPACVDKDTGAPVSSGPKTADPTASAADNY
ncbi:MAG: hypothetical protein FWD69_15565, partial [Polyangiaceae bacterium]|nr:hypothetical protein [Polyangiaceae bacterium]